MGNVIWHERENISMGEPMLCIDEKVAELVGAFLGDGYTYGKFGRYQVGFVGHKKDDRAFFEELSKTMRIAAGGRPQLRERFRGLRLRVNNKRLYEFLVKDLKLDYKGEKSYNVTIPEPLLNDWALTKACLRGLLATDGSIFTARKPGVEKYPSIEITTVSEKLANQLVNILKEKGFRVRMHWYDPKNDVQVRTFKVSLNGWGMLRKWYEEIGISHPLKKQKAEEILSAKYGNGKAI